LFLKADAIPGSLEAFSIDLKITVTFEFFPFSLVFLWISSSPGKDIT
jgi:hypothetical protein